MFGKSKKISGVDFLKNAISNSPNFSTINFKSLRKIQQNTSYIWSTSSRIDTDVINSIICRPGQTCIRMYFVKWVVLLGKLNVLSITK